MSASPEAIAAEARSWIGTPYMHQRSEKGVGADCGGLVRGVARGCGYVRGDPMALPAAAPYRGYGPLPDGVTMLRACHEFLTSIPFREHRLGDVLLFQVSGDPTHAGIIVGLEPLTMVHSFNRPGVMRVIENTVDIFWRRRVVGCFRYRGLA